MQGAHLLDPMGVYRRKTGTVVSATAALLGEAWLNFGRVGRPRSDAASQGGPPRADARPAAALSLTAHSGFGLSAGTEGCQWVSQEPAGVQRSQRLVCAGPALSS